MSLGSRASSSGLIAPVASVWRTIAYHGVGPASVVLVWSYRVLRRPSVEREVIPPGLRIETSPVHGGRVCAKNCGRGWCHGCPVQRGRGVIFQLLEECWHLFT